MIMMLVSDIRHHIASLYLFPEEIKIEKYQDLMIFIFSPSVELYFGVISKYVYDLVFRVEGSNDLAQSEKLLLFVVNLNINYIKLVQLPFLSQALPLRKRCYSVD